MSFKEKIFTKFGNMGHKIKQKSPEILIVTGITGTVVAAIMACKATTKASKILETTRTELDCVHKAKEKYIDNPEAIQVEEEVYTMANVRKDTAHIYAKTALSFVRLYAPSVVLGTLSLGSVVASNRILKKRNAALAAAYATLDTSFKNYRARVVEKYGKDADYQLFHDIKAVEIEEKAKDDKGKEKTVKKTVDVINDLGPYARYFDESNPNYERNSDYNFMFLRSQQQYLNDLLMARSSGGKIGSVFLNDAFDALGYPRTKAGQVTGWKYDPNKETDGDGYIDFGIKNVHRPIIGEDGETRYEETIILDFNVDGYILDDAFDGD